MAANFYLSSHANYHLHPRSVLVAARIDDLKYATEQELGWIEIWSGTAIQKLCKRLGLRQQVIATAIVYLRRFYLRNSYCETDAPLVISACCYVAAKAEETPVHVKSAVSEARAVFTEMGYTTFPTDNTKLAEMEFYLIEELDFHLIVYHPYRSLVQLCGRDTATSGSTEGISGSNDRACMLDMDDAALQMAWFVINDTFRSSLCLIYPPHLIALAAIYLALSLHAEGSSSTTSSSAASGPSSNTRRQSISLDAGSGKANRINSQALLARPGGHVSAVPFLASLNADFSIIIEIIQEVISLYELWNSLESSAPAPPSQAKSDNGSVKLKTITVNADERVLSVLARMRLDRLKDLKDAETHVKRDKVDLNRRRLL